jgi:hypothetical protein
MKIESELVNVMLICLAPSFKKINEVEKIMLKEIQLKFQI